MLSTLFFLKNFLANFCLLKFWMFLYHRLKFTTKKMIANLNRICSYNPIKKFLLSSRKSCKLVKTIANLKSLFSPVRKFQIQRINRFFYDLKSFRMIAWIVLNIAWNSLRFVILLRNLWISWLIVSRNSIVFDIWGLLSHCSYSAKGSINTKLTILFPNMLYT